MRQLHAIGELRDAIQHAKRGDLALRAGWTGQYNSDLFHIDELTALEAAGD
jgi:hypothetical protein